MTHHLHIIQRSPTLGLYGDQRRYLNIILAFLSFKLTPNEHENKAEALHAPPTLYGQLLKDPGGSHPQICPALRVSSLQRRCTMNLGGQLQDHQISRADPIE